MTRRLVPAALLAAIAALLAFAALRPADSPGRPIPASVVSETKVGEVDAMNAKAPRALQEKHPSSPAPSRETPRQKARRIIAATWPPSQVANAMRVVKCETGGTYSQWALGDNGNSVSWFQIHLPSHPWVSRARARNNPWYATRAALRIWRESGWGAWTCARILGIA